MISRGRNEQAFGVIQRLHKDVNDPNDIFAYREFEQIKQQYALDRENEVSWREMFVRPSYRKRLIIGFIVMFASQTTGTTVINSKFLSISLLPSHLPSDLLTNKTQTTVLSSTVILGSTPVEPSLLHPAGSPSLSAATVSTL